MLEYAIYHPADGATKKNEQDGAELPALEPYKGKKKKRTNGLGVYIAVGSQQF